MESRFRTFWCVVAVGFVLTPVVSWADYQPADRALEKLESVVKLSAAQEKQALRIFQNLKDVMDSLPPAGRPAKGAQSRQDAIAAIRAILTPEQQAIYDRTPQRLGGGAKSDAVMQGLNQRIRTAVSTFAKSAPAIVGKVGNVQKVGFKANGSSTRSSGDVPDGAAHPESGVSVISVTGSTGTKDFKVSWEMDASETIKVTQIEDGDK